jgi:hypothetical protein
MINKYLQNFSTSLAIREMQIKTALWFYLMEVRMTNHQENKQQ